MRFLFIFPLFLPLFVSGQSSQRNLLQRECAGLKLEEVLIRQSAFKPFPVSPGDWKKAITDSIVQGLTRAGEAAMTGDFPNIPATTALDFLRNGNRTRYENIMFTKRNRLWNLVLAESIDGNGRFLDAIADGIWSICEESFWGTPAHLFLQKAGPGLPDIEDPVVDLFAAETASTLAWAYYFVGARLDSVSPLIRPRIYYEVNRRVFIPLKTASYEWMGGGGDNARLNNWAPWIVSNYLAAALLLESDDSKRVDHVAKAIRITDQYINGFGDDGACEEGPHYWTFGAGCLLDILELLRIATGDHVNIYNEPVIRNIGAYIYRVHIDQNYFFNVADSPPETNPQGIMVWRYGKAVGDQTLRSFGAWLHRRAGYINPTFHRVRALLDLFSLRTIAREQQAYSAVDATWMPDVQLMTRRVPGLYVAAHGGHNAESHNHNDVGDFIVYAEGEPVIIDVGSGTYTSKTFSKERYSIWFNSSSFHNLPTINGYEQFAGSGAKATGVVYENRENRTVLRMNIASAYPSQSALKSLHREIAAGPKGIRIIDQFYFDRPENSITQSFMTICRVNIDKPGTIVFITGKGRRVSLAYDPAWKVELQPMNLLSEEEEGLKVTWGNRPIKRVLLTRKKAPAGVRVSYSIQSDSVNGAKAR